MEEVSNEPVEIEIEIGATRREERVPGNFSPGTTSELLQSLSGEDWAETATLPLGSP